MLQTQIFGILLCVAGAFAFYEGNSDVVQLDPQNFDKLVTNSDEIWLVEFYAPWCGHCKNLIPEYQKVAKALKGIAKVGALDADKHNSFSHSFGVSGFPTIKIFNGKKHTPYQGQRTAEKFIDAILKAAKDKAYDALGKKPSGSDKQNELYGHSIVWKKVRRNTSTTTTVPKPVLRTAKHIQQKNITKHTNTTKMSLARFNELQLQLFRRKLKDSGYFKVIKTDYLNKRHKILKKVKQKIGKPTTRKNILKKAK